MEEHVFKNGEMIRIFESKSGNPIKHFKYIESKGWKVTK